MKKYRYRLAWYFAVLIVNFGFLLIGIKVLFLASFSALWYYLPLSIFWFFAGSWLFGEWFRSSSAFCIKAERLGFFVIGIGALGAVLFLLQDNEKLAAMAIFAAMCGGEGVIWVREARYSAGRPRFRS